MPPLTTFSTPRMPRRAHSVPIAALLLLSACATTTQIDERSAQWEASQREEIEALKRAVEATYDRERAMADRLQNAEENNAQLRQELDALKAQNEALQTEIAAVPVAPPPLGHPWAAFFTSFFGFLRKFRSFSVKNRMPNRFLANLQISMNSDASNPPKTMQNQ